MFAVLVTVAVAAAFGVNEAQKDAMSRTGKVTASVAAGVVQDSSEVKLLEGPALLVARELHEVKKAITDGQGEH